MLGRKERDQLELFITGSLRQLVPDEHVLARVDRVLDLSWLREEVSDCYCASDGRPGIDPEAAVRLMLAGLLTGIVHDRKLIREAQVNIAIRWFTGYRLHEQLPHHSSLTRIRQRWGEERFRRIFKRTVQACLKAKIATAEVVHIDASLIRANVSWDSLTDDIKVVTADAGYAYAKVYGALERRGIDALIPAKAEPIKSRVPLRRFRYDAKNDILKCPRGRILRPARPIKHGRFFYSKAKDCARCPLKGDCLSKGRVNKAVVVGDHYPALLRARRRRERWSKQDRRLYQRHRWRSEGFHGEAKTWHGLARAIRRGLPNMKIQAYLTAAAINLKRLATALLAFILSWIVPHNAFAASDRTVARALTRGP